MPQKVIQVDTSGNIKDIAPSAFGEVVTVGNTPIMQFDFPHITPPRTFEFARNGASVGRNASLGMMQVSSGTTSGALAVFRSERALVYRPGQGNMARFTAMYTTPVADSTQTAGLFTTTDGFAFGYDGTQFGIMHRRGGELQIEHLQITTPSGGAENATVTVRGTAYTVPLTGAGTVQDDAREIAASMNTQDFFAVYEQIDDTVIYVSLLAQVETTFTYSSSTSVGSWTQITVGAPVTDTWVYQDNWNIDTRSDLDPTKLNVFQIQYQRAGAVTFFIEDSDSGALVPVHVIQYANQNVVPNLTNPNLFLAIVASSEGSTTDLTVSTASMSAFRQGEDVQTGQTESRSATKTVLSGAEESILTISVRNDVGGRASHGELVLDSISVSNEAGKNATFRVTIGAAVADTNYQYHDEAQSLAIYDTSGTTVTGGRTIQIIVAATEMGETVNIRGLNEQLLSGETITISAEFASGPAADMTASLTWVESV